MKNIILSQAPLDSNEHMCSSYRHDARTSTFASSDAIQQCRVHSFAIPIRPTLPDRPSEKTKNCAPTNVKNETQISKSFPILAVCIYVYVCVRLCLGRKIKAGKLSKGRQKRQMAIVHLLLSFMMSLFASDEQ